MSTLKSVEKGNTVKIVLTNGKSVKGKVGRIAKRGGDVAALFLEDGTRIGVAKIAELNGSSLKKVSAKPATAKGKDKGKGKKRTAIKGASAETKPKVNGVSLGDLRKAANGEIKVIRASVAELRRNLVKLSKAIGKKDEEYDVTGDLAYTDEAILGLKENLAELSPSNYR